MPNMRRRRFLSRSLPALMGSGGWFLWRNPAKAGAAGTPRELLRDPQFRSGFNLVEPKPGRRVIYGNIAGTGLAAEPVWDLDQWSSRHPLAAGASNQATDGSLEYGNAAKSVILAPRGSAHADLVLGVVGSAEYGNQARKKDEPWVHLLVEQRIENPPALSEISNANFRLEARLLRARRVTTPDYTPNLHAAQFQVFFTVQNRNRQSPGFGRLLWFGVPVYDDRHRHPPGHRAQDTAGSNMFIYTPAAERYFKGSAHDQQWVTIERDLLPLIIEGLEQAREKGFLRESRELDDYRITTMNMGWEVPGIFDVAMQVRGLSLRIVGKAAD